MRRLLWFSLGFGGICLICVYFLWGRTLWVPAAICGCSWILLRCIGLKWEKACPIAALFLGCCAALLWFSFFKAAYLGPVLTLDGQKVSVTVIASEYSGKSQYGDRVSGWFLWEGKPYQISLSLKKGVSLAPGDAVTAEFLIRLTVPEGEKESLYQSGSGLFLLGTQKSDAVIDSSSQDAWFLIPQKAANRLRDILEASLPKDTAPFAKALLLGDTDGLDYETDTALKLSGIRHVAAVSGLHVGLLYGIIRTLTFRKRWLTALVGIPVLAFFAAMAGFSPSVSRACLMTGLAMVADALLKEYDSLSALSFGVLVLLLLNPFSAASVSLQLSVTSVTGILLLYPGIHEWYQKRTAKLPGKGIPGKIIRWFGSSAGISLSAMALTTPLSAFYFGTVSLIAVVTNLLTLWCVMFIFCGAAFLCFAGLLWMPASLFLGKLLAWPIRYVLFVAKILSRFPLAAVYTRSGWITGWLILGYLLLVVFLIRKKNPLFYAGACAVGLAAALFLSWWMPRQDDFRATVLDVGQGQCILLQSHGSHYLVDCGSGSGTAAADAAAEMLLSQGIHRLDGIILTHLDQDHINGLGFLLTRVETRALLLSEDEEAGFIYELPLRNTAVSYIDRIQTIPLGAGTMTLYPPKAESKENDNCICVLFAVENYDILITGDRTATGEWELVRNTELPDVDILIAGHHGSKYSTSQFLLDAVKPKTVVISVGENNIYGHPAPELLERLELYHCRILRTDLNGTVVFRR